MVAVLVFGALLNAGAADASAGRAGDALRGDWGVILPASKQPELLRPCSRCRPRGLGGHWMPSTVEIERLERHLVSVLEKALARVILEQGERRPAASDYYRQYGGFYRSGRRVVYVNGVHQRVVHEVTGCAAACWTSEPLGLCDGGLMGFGAVYDVAADRLDGFEFDGRFSGRIRMK